MEIVVFSGSGLWKIPIFPGHLIGYANQKKRIRRKRIQRMEEKFFITASHAYIGNFNYMVISDENLFKTIKSAQHLLPKNYCISVLIDKEYVYAELIMKKPFKIIKPDIDYGGESVSTQLKYCIALAKKLKNNKKGA